MYSTKKESNFVDDKAVFVLPKSSILVVVKEDVVCDLEEADV